MSVIFIQSAGAGAGGGDVTPSAMNWADITNVGSTRQGLGYNAAVTIAGITSPITLKAAWTSTSGAPAKGVWVVNGISYSPTPAVSPIYTTVTLGADVYFWMTAATAGTGVGNNDSGTVTITNDSDGGAGIDTFTFAIQFVPILPTDDGGDPP